MHIEHREFLGFGFPEIIDFTYFVGLARRFSREPKLKISFTTIRYTLLFLPRP